LFVNSCVVAGRKWTRRKIGVLIGSTYQFVSENGTSIKRPRFAEGDTCLGECASNAASTARINPTTWMIESKGLLSETLSEVSEEEDGQSTQCTKLSHQ
jgi:hypothetical protein